MSKTFEIAVQLSLSMIQSSSLRPTAMHQRRVNVSVKGDWARVSHSPREHYECQRWWCSTTFPCTPASLYSATGRSSFHGLRLQFPRARTFHLPVSSRCRTVLKISKRGGSEARAASEGRMKEQPVIEKRSAFRCLTKLTTAYNRIVILEAPESSSSEFAGSRVLLLDNSRNVQSVYKRGSLWTNFYWDEFASLPAIIPAGPVAIFGLGGGTAARVLLELWPSLKVEGFEIDEIVVEEARRLLGLSELEVPTPEGGCLNVHVDDAFSPSSSADGEFAGILVDIFSEGEVAYELQQPETWSSFKRRLMPGGRIMVNCGGVCVENSDPESHLDDGTWTWQDGGSRGDATLRAMASAFPAQLSWRQTGSTNNCLALSGPLPDLGAWAAALPEQLKAGVASWRSYQ